MQQQKKVFSTKNFTRKRHQQIALKKKMTPTKNGLHKTTTPTTIKSQHRRQPTTSMIRRTKPALRQPKHLTKQTTVNNGKTAHRLSTFQAFLSPSHWARQNTVNVSARLSPLHQANIPHPQRTPAEGEQGTGAAESTGHLYNKKQKHWHRQGFLLLRACVLLQLQLNGSPIS